MLYDYDFNAKIIDIPLGTSSILVQTLYSDIKDAEATTQGIAYGQIASASGNESLGGSVSVGVTVNLLDDWQIRFASGNYIAKVSGGNLVGGFAGDPVAYSAGVQVLLIQSAASTIVSVSGAYAITGDISQIPNYVPSAADVADQVLLSAQSTPIYANIKQVADSIVNGSGTEADPWGPDGGTPTPSGDIIYDGGQF